MLNVAFQYRVQCFTIFVEPVDVSGLNIITFTTRCKIFVIVNWYNMYCDFNVSRSWIWTIQNWKIYRGIWATIRKRTKSSTASAIQQFSCLKWVKIQQNFISIFLLLVLFVSHVHMVFTLFELALVVLCWTLTSLWKCWGLQWYSIWLDTSIAWTDHISFGQI